MATRVLIVGAGGMAQAWAKLLIQNPQTVIAGWADILPNKAQESAQNFGLTIPTSTDFPALLDQTKPDFVLDITIPEAHHDVTTHALNSGYPVLGEKPMAATLDQAQNMVNTANKTGLLYMVSQSRRYHPYLEAYKALIDQIGDLGILNADFYLGPHFGGFRDEMPSPLLLDMAIHTFDAARYLTGKNMVACHSFQFNPSWSWMKGDACANVIFEMEDGIIFSYRGSWVAEGLNTSWEAEWRAHGSLGAATWDGHETLKAQVVTKVEGFMSEHQDLHPQIPAPYLSGIEGSLQDFLQALNSKSDPTWGRAQDNINSLKMVMQAAQ